MAMSLSTEVRMIKGVGPQRAQLLAERGICTLEDLLGYLPFRYEDRIHFSKVKDIQPNGTYTIRARVMSGQAIRNMRFRRDAIYHLLVQDEAGGLLPCKFFHGGYLESRLKPGQLLILHGKAEIDRLRPARLEMINPQIELLNSDEMDSTEVGRIVPIYEAIGTFGSKQIRRAMYASVQSIDSRMADVLSESLRTRLGYPSRGEALIHTHFPEPTESLDALNTFRSPAQQRLIFEEFFLYQLSLSLDRRATRKENAIAFRVREDRIREALKRVLPFKPTEAQKRVLAEIVADLEKPAPMNRLLQGDVGSGKTIIALQAAVIAIENGTQATLMAPTEILAVQHFLSARRILGKTGYRVALLISGLKFAEKQAVLQRIKSGEAQLVIGTHALIEESVEFARLGFVAIDEQHRFGVMQRKRLMDKAASHGHAPHVLVLTATPIPRTLSLTLYGDLDVSVLDELPPGRTPIATRVTSEPHLPGVWESLRREVLAGIRASFERSFPQIETRLAAWQAFQRRERRSHAALPPERGANPGDHHRRGSGRGRAQRYRDDHRTCRAFRTCAAPPASRAHWPQRAKVSLHPGGAVSNDRRSARAARYHGAHVERLRNRRGRSAASRAGRIFRYAAIRRAGLSHCQPSSRPGAARTRAQGSLRARRRRSAARGAEARFADAARRMAAPLSSGPCRVTPQLNRSCPISFNPALGQE